MKNIHYTDASAGTGKTYSLTHKFADLVKAGQLNPEKAIVTTFTRAAAAELKTRTRAVLYEYKLFSEADRFDRSVVGTIDSIASSFIKRYWQTLRLFPDPKILAEDNYKDYASAFLSGIVTPKDRELFNNVLSIFQMLDYSTMTPKYNFWSDLVLQIVDAAVAGGMTPADLHADMTECVNAMTDIFRPSVTDLMLKHSANDLCVAVSDFYALPKNAKYMGKDTHTKRLKLVEALTGKPIDDRWIKAYSTLSSDKTIAKNCITYSLEQCGLVCKWLVDCYTRIYEIAIETLKKFEAKKKEDRYLTYPDIEKYFYELLENNTEVRDDVKSSFSHLFVDEFQDSSAMQVRIFLKLADILGDDNCWFYGDEKQVLYSWRGADVDLTSVVRSQMHAETPLTDTYRQREELCAFTNDFFSGVFQGMPKIESKKGKGGKLEIWKVPKLSVDIPSNRCLAYRIQELIESDSSIAPSDIAVLARYNSNLDNLAECLTLRGIPANRESGDCSETIEAKFILATISLIKNPSDRLAMSILMNLSYSDTSLNDIIGQLLAGGKSVIRMADIKKRFQSLSEELSGYSLTEMVKALIYREDVFNVCKKWGEASARKANLLHIIDLAASYEDDCAEKMQACTVDGFKEYMHSKDAKAKGSLGGVVLTTYHKSKGLQWPIVIVKEDSRTITKENEICGVHVEYETVPTANTLFPGKHIILFPNVYKTISDDLAAAMAGNAFIAKYMNIEYDKVMKERNRLYYVACTRAKNMLVLATEEELEAFLSIRSENFATDVFAVKDAPTEDEVTKESESTESALSREFVLPVDGVIHEKRDWTPSKIKVDNVPEGLTALGNTVLNKEENYAKIELLTKGIADNVRGDCIHHIFGVAPLWDNLPEQEACKVIAGIAAQYGIEFVDPCAVIKAWVTLNDYLTKNYGGSVECRHEMPFIHYDAAGHIFTGTMDLLVETPNGCVIVDYKTFEADSVAAINAHIADEGYGYELACYREAVKASGANVLGTVLFFPMTGYFVEIC